MPDLSKGNKPAGDSLLVVHELDNVKNAITSSVLEGKETNALKSEEVKDEKLVKCIPVLIDQNTQTSNIAAGDQENIPREEIAANVDKTDFAKVTNEPALDTKTVIVGRDVEVNEKCKRPKAKLVVKENLIEADEGTATDPKSRPDVTIEKIKRSQCEVKNASMRLTAKESTPATKDVMEENNTTGDEEVVRLTTEDSSAADIPATSSPKKMEAAKECSMVSADKENLAQKSATEDKLVTIDSQISRDDEVSNERSQESATISLEGFKVQRDLEYVESERKCLKQPVDMKKFETEFHEEPRRGKETQSQVSQKTVWSAAEPISPIIEPQSKVSKNMKVEQTGQDAEVEKTPVTKGSSAETGIEIENEPTKENRSQMVLTTEPKLGGEGGQLEKSVSAVGREISAPSCEKAITLEVSEKPRADHKSDDTEQSEETKEPKTDVYGSTWKVEVSRKQSRLPDVAREQETGENLEENKYINSSTITLQHYGYSNKENEPTRRDIPLVQQREESINKLKSNLKSSRDNPAKPAPMMRESRRKVNKSRGKPQGKVGSKTRRSYIATPKAVQVTNCDQVHLATPKIPSASRVIRRRGLTGASKRESEKNPRKKRRKVEGRKTDLQHLQTYNSDLRRRIKNVKSKLFSETKCFRAYKSARQEEALQRRKKRTKVIAKETELRYADRSIDFNKKSKRQQELLRRNLNFTK